MRIIAPTDSAIAPAMSLGVVCTVCLMSWFSAGSTRCQLLTTFQNSPTSTRIEPSSSWKVFVSGGGKTVFLRQPGVGVVVLVVWIVSSIQVIQSLQSGVNCVAELVVFVNEHNISKITKY